LDLKRCRGRVQSAILVYLLLFCALNAGVWIWFVLHRNVPGHHFPLGERSQRFGDLLHFTAKYQIGTSPSMGNPDGIGGTLFPRNYPALAVLVYLFLLQVCAPYALPVLLAAVLGSIAVACTMLWRRVRTLEGYRWYIAAAIFATGFFGWGTEQTVMRGNIEGLVWIAVCLGAALYARRSYRGAAVSFGVACCLKPYPVLWLGLMARQRRYKQAVLGLLTAVAVTLASLFALDRNPVRAYRTISGKSLFYSNWVAAFRPMEEMKGDHSLFQTMKTIARVVRNHGLNFPSTESMVRPNDPLALELYHVYLPIAALIGLVVLWRVWNKPVLNQIFALACVTVVLPVLAGDYTLNVLLVPMGFFLIFLLEDVAQGRTPLSLGRILWFLLPCAWIMATEPQVILHGVFKCIALLVLLGASISISLPSTLFSEIATGQALGTAETENE
jgi:hypothetical protein